MTQEQIEAARERLIEFVGDVINDAPELDTDEPMELIDALCAAASEPESLVGRKVRLNGNNADYWPGTIGTIESAQFIIKFSDSEDDYDDFEWDDFELLEDDNA